MYCTYCGNEIHPRLWLPGKCKRCRHSFEWKPRWIPNVILLVSLLPPLILTWVFRHVSTGAAVMGFVGGFALTFVIFNLLEVLAYRAGLLTSDLASEEPVEVRTHVKKPLSELDPVTRAKVEISRIKMPEGVTLKGDDSDAGRQQDQAQSPTPAQSSTPRGGMCRFERIDLDEPARIEEMSHLATTIVREHFDPIIGKAQNDYMIGLFQTPSAITQQLAEGYEYYFVYLGQEGDPEAPTQNPIGFVSYQKRGEVLYLSKFYLVSEERGKGLSHDMLAFVCQEAWRLGCSRVVLNVNRNNFQAILAYEHLGFTKVGEERRDIGGGFAMDDVVYALPVTTKDNRQPRR